MDAKQQLQKLIQDLKEKKFKDQATQASADVIRNESQGIMASIQAEQTKVLKPVLEGMAKEMSDSMIKSFETAIKAIKVDVPKIDSPVVNVSDFPNYPEFPPFPEIKLPKITIPEIKVPPARIIMPSSMTVDGVVGLKGFDNRNPLPVKMMGEDGKPLQINIPVSMGGSGGKADFFTIKDIQTSAGLSIIDNDGFVKVTGSFTTSGSTGAIGQGDSASASRVVIAGNSDASVVVNSGTLTSVTTLTSITNSVATALTDSGGVQYSGSNPLPVSPSVALNQGDALTAQRVVIAGNSDASVVVNSGTLTTVTTLTSITNSVGTVLLDSSGVAYSGSNPVPTSASITLPSGQGDAATATRMVIAGNSDASVVVNSGTLTTVTTLTSITNSVGTVLLDSSGVAYSGSNPVPTTATISLPSGQGDAATATRMVIAGNSDASVVVNSGTLTTVTTLTSITNSVGTVLTDSGGVQYSGSNPIPTNNVQWNSVAPATGLNETNTGVVRMVQMTDSASSVSATQVGTWNIGTVTTLTGITNSVSTALTDSSGIQYSGSNPVPITWVSGAGATIGAMNIDSSGVGYSGSNPLPITIISGALTSTLAVGDSAARSADNGGNPVKVGGIARTTNPTAYADGDRSNFGTDKIGRQLTRNVQVRDLISTAYVSKATGSTFGTETTLLAGVTGTFLDLVYVMGTNDSNVSVNCDFRSVTAGNVVFTLTIPSGGTTGLSLQVPIPQDATGNNWTIDLPDITGTNVTVSALFSKEI